MWMLWIYTFYYDKQARAVLTIHAVKVSDANVLGQEEYRLNIFALIVQPNQAQRS